jgi:shikimate O-hydroxycinnamoyltransferase
MPWARFFIVAWSMAMLKDFDDIAPSKAMNDTFVPKYDSMGPDAPPASGCYMR